MIIPKDVEPYTIVGGNPAKYIRKRFDEELTQLLLKLHWWDFSPEALVDFLPVLCDSNLESVRLKIKNLLQA